MDIEMDFNFPDFNKHKLEQGILLLSEPFLADNYFTRSVILIAEHNESGTIGFIINKISEIKISEAIEDFYDFNGEIFFGGPVNKDNLYFIHTIGDKIKGAVEIFPGLFWGGDFDELKEIAIREKLTSNQLRFYAGYAGWAPEQLNKELEEKSWIVCKPNFNLLMGDDFKNLWGDMLKTMGPEYAKMINYPIDPNLN